jgi:predicted dehydrogenase
VQSRELVTQLAKARLPSVVNFTQAASRGFEELSRSIQAGEAGELLGIDIVVNYPAWPRAWQRDADWLRFRHEGGYTREVISHFLFLAERFLGPLTLQHALPRYPQDPALCELAARSARSDCARQSHELSVQRVLPTLALRRQRMARSA